MVTLEPRYEENETSESTRLCWWRSLRKKLKMDETASGMMQYLRSSYGKCIDQKHKSGPINAHIIRMEKTNVMLLA